MINILVQWLIYLHVLCVLTFFLMHGPSAAMAFKIRRESDFARIRAMLELSESTVEMMFLAFVGMILTGVIIAFLLHLWDQVWVWASLVLMLFVFIWMVWMSEGSYKALRKLIGLPYRQGSKEYPAEPPASAEEVDALLKRIRVKDLLVAGYMIPAIVLWLVIFKPF